MSKDKKSNGKASKGKDSKGNKKNFFSKNNIIKYSLITCLFIGLFFVFLPNKKVDKVTQQNFMRNLEKGSYSEVTVTNQVTSSGLIIKYKEKDIKDKKGKTDTITVLNSDKMKDELSEKSEKSKTKLYMENPSNNSSLFMQLFSTIVPLAIMLYILKGFLPNNKKSSAKEIVEKSKTTFKDVAGKDEEKAELQDIINYFKNPKKYQERKIVNPTGVLFEGPPGTGKTLLAKALAGESNASFFYMSGAEFNGMFRGGGTTEVKSLFKRARENAPSIIFIDEIDALAKRRGGGINDRDSEQTLNQLLTELDGFQEYDEQVVILGATNLADSLDPAVLRSGRFDRKVYVGLPNKFEREKILEYYIKDLNIDKDVDITSLGEQIQGFSGADIESFVNEANLGSFNANRETITSDDFEKAFNKVIVGVEKKSTVYTPEQKVIIANHESGHALVGALVEGGKKVKKVTIVPHGRAGGFAMMLPKDEMFVQTKDYLENTIVTLLAGRGAEELMSNTQTTGVSQDIKEATEIAKGMIATYGMANSFQYRTLEDFNQKELGDLVDSILNKAYEKSKQVISDNMPRINLLSKVLQDKETLYEKEIDYIVSLENEYITENFDTILSEIMNRNFKEESKEIIVDNDSESEDDIYEKDSEDKKPKVVHNKDIGKIVKEKLSKDKVTNE